MDSTKNLKDCPECGRQTYTFEKYCRHCEADLWNGESECP